MKFVSATAILRGGLIFVFAYAGAAALLEPANWIGYVPPGVKNIMGDYTTALLAIHAVFELALAVWLIWGKWLKYAALVAFLDLATITVFNLSLLDIIFRDVGLAFAALALYFSKQEQL